MTKSALIFGVNGQDGYYLGKLLAGRGYSVAGAGTSAQPNADVAEFLASYHKCDIADAKAVARLLEKSRPDEIYNLAFFLSVEWGEIDEAKARAVNVGGVKNIINAMKAHARDARLFQASTGYIFKPSMEKKNEKSPIGPYNDYAKSKWDAHLEVQAARKDGLFAANGILFTHESPRHPPKFLMPKVALAAAEFAAGIRRDPLPLGDLRPIRDIGFAGDYAEAMHLMMEAETPQDYVIATGIGHPMRDVCEQAFAEVGMDYRKCVTSEPELVRRQEVDYLVGDPAKIKSELGWSARTSFEQLVKMMVQSCLEKLDSARKPKK